MSALSGVLLSSLTLDRESPVPIYRQLYKLLQELVLSGKLPANSRMPSSRVLAQELDVSRVTVRFVYEHLVQEGYFTSATGKGTFVRDHPVIRELSTAQSTRLRARNSQARDSQARDSQARDFLTGEKTPPKPNEVAPPVISDRAKRFLSLPISYVTPQSRPFNPANPDFSHFPFEKWIRIVKKSLIQSDYDAMCYGEGSGYSALKKAIAQYLSLSRGFTCDDEQIVIFSSVSQAVSKAAFLLLDDGDHVWCGEPGMAGRRNAILATGAIIDTIGVDDKGVIVSQAYSRAKDAKLAYVLPARHYPLGMTMSLSRRLEILQWASRNDAWIIEDDYCSEFNYGKHLPPSLKSLDKEQRVIYVGGFGETIFPSLRLAYMVLPKTLCGYVQTMAEADMSVSSVMQPALATFITDGYYTSHIRKMRKINLRRGKFLADYLKQKLGDSVKISGTGGGFNIILELPEQINSRKLSETLHEYEIVCHPVFDYYFNPTQSSDCRNALVLGYACASRSALKSSADILINLIRSDLGGAVT